MQKLFQQFIETYIIYVKVVDQNQALINEIKVGQTYVITMKSHKYSLKAKVLNVYSDAKLFIQRFLCQKTQKIKSLQLSLLQLTGNFEKEVLKREKRKMSPKTSLQRFYSGLWLLDFTIFIRVFLNTI